MAFLHPDPFDPREPKTTDQAEAVKSLVQCAKTFREIVNAAAPAASREKSLALTNLEQALMWAQRAAVPMPAEPPIPPPRGG